MGGSHPSQSFPSRALDDLRGMRFPGFGRLGFVVWELAITSVTAVAGATAPDQAEWWQRVVWALGLALAGAATGLIGLYILLLPTAIWRQRVEALALLSAGGHLSEVAATKLLSWEQAIVTGQVYPGDLGSDVFNELHAAGLVEVRLIGGIQRVAYTRKGSQVVQIMNRHEQPEGHV